jgi:hypothetical protein
MSAFIDGRGPPEELEAESASRGQVEIAYAGRSFQSAEDGEWQIHPSHVICCNAFSWSPGKGADPDVSNFPNGCQIFQRHG